MNMENLEGMTNEQLVEKIRELESKNRSLDTDLWIANQKMQKFELMERVVKAVGIAVDFYRIINKEG